MRTVSFSNEQLQNTLNRDFVCVYTNTQGERSAGSSFSHAPDDLPGPCGRGAGRQNVQTIFLTPAGEIFHVATGFLEADDLLEEMQFAKQCFAMLHDHPRRDKQAVVAAHLRRLRQLGFSRQEIASRDHPLSEMVLSGPNPQDFGINMPTPRDFGVNMATPFGQMFGDAARQRRLKDHKFVLANPLLSQETFQQHPESLVGNHHSFFGSHSAMNGIGQQFDDLRRGRTSQRRR